MDHHLSLLAAFASPDERRLWTDLARFDFDSLGATEGLPGSGFTSRLARENGWSRAHACSVIDEYRRFVFLSQVLDHRVTPSDQVDQAWHLHLTYTRSYWDDLCGRVLEQPFHHEPTRGGAVEGAKFEDWYTRTLQGYERWFGEKPPAEFWPDPAIRIGEAPQWVRIDTKRSIVINRPRRLAGPRSRVGMVAAGSMSLASYAGLGPGGFLAQEDGGGSSGGGFVLLVFLAIAVLIALLRHWLGGGSGDGGGHGCGAGCGGD